MSAMISPDGLYRYWLQRETGIDNDKIMLFVMLNPSVADAVENDPTIRRCIGYAKREGFGMLEVVNLFAFISTDPDGLKLA